MPRWCPAAASGERVGRLSGRVPTVVRVAADDDSGGGGEPPVVLSHIAYFFVPLPEPLGLADKSVLPIREGAPAAWWEAGDGVPPPVHTAGSLMFHQTTRPSPETDEVGVLVEIAKAAVPGADQPDWPPAGSGAGQPDVEMTVVEMAVGFDMPPGADDNAGDEGEDEDGAFRDALSDAFDRGLQYVRDVQRAYYTARRRPVRLVSREAMPFAVPFAVRRVYDDDGELVLFTAALSMFLLHMNVTFRDGDLDDSERQTFAAALRHQTVGGAFSSYLEFVREGDVALGRDGAYRAAVMFTATACEVLLDDLLAHLLWEDRVRPEDAARVFESFLTARVKREYHPRLDGSWTVERDGPVRSWATDVADLRNRVVHAGYEPTLQEARAAADAAQDLNAHLCDAVAAKAAAYPRTALLLPGADGLRRRGLWTRRLDELQDDPSEVPWTETFGRWRLAMRRARADSPVAVAPSAAAGWVYLVVRADGRTQWVVHDRAAGLAAAVDRSAVSGVLPGQQEALDGLSSEILAGGEHDDVSVRVAGARVAGPPPQAWLPEYRLVPLAGVMVDGNDLDPA